MTHLGPYELNIKSKIELLYGIDVLDGLRGLSPSSVQCCVTSPPYWGLRNYGVDGQIGLEKTPEEYVANTLAWCREVRRVLRDDGTFWLNLGDSYAGSGKGIGSEPDPKWTGARNDENKSKTDWSVIGLKPKDLVGIPWMVAFALRNDGWYLRSDIIWAKPNPMPESVTDRPSRAHEYIFLLTKSRRYFYDAEAIKTPARESSISRWNQDVEKQVGSDRGNGGAKTNGTMKAVGGSRKSTNKSDEQKSAYFGHAPTNLGRCGTNEEGTCNARSVWNIATQPYSGSHYATFPTALAEKCIRAGSKEGDTILDPFNGSGTTSEVAARLNRSCIGIDLDERNRKLAHERLASVGLLFTETTNS